MLNQPDRILRERDLAEFDGMSDSGRDRERRKGLYPKNFPISPDPTCRARGNSRREIIARQQAVIAGRSEDEIRALVKTMDDARDAGLLWEGDNVLQLVNRARDGGES